MRLLVGVDANGHQYAVDVSSWEKLKAYLVKQLINLKELNLLGEIKDKQSEESLIEDQDIMDQLHDLQLLGQGRDLFTELYDPLPEANDPLVNDEIPLAILQAASAVSLQASLVASKVSRILDAVLWEKSGKKAAELVRDLDRMIRETKEKSFVEGKASTAPKEALKIFDEVLQSMESQVSNARISIQQIKDKKDGKSY